GASGSGKSTFSQRLASQLAQPLIEMDALFWNRNWSESPDEQFFARLRSALAQPRWVLDGNYDRTLPIKWQDVTAVIWLDYSLPRTLLQGIQRGLFRAWTRVELWPGTGNRESFRTTFFSKKSVLLWSLRSHAKLRTRYGARMTDPAYAQIAFFRLRSPAEAQAFLQSITRMTLPGVGKLGVYQPKHPSPPKTAATE
ncbi:MAG TPA: hypothetical protein VHM25_26235, partial [Polyangiaceae bacterium]|nr:hypothetical protein [Polyangiaceae bacterium]